ncbi:MAG: hypothetical protein NT009_05415 [Proteobacteria bacterium]|nr:hypothetical protein [Pseudomonadota bacterium]
MARKKLWGKKSGSDLVTAINKLVEDRLKRVLERQRPLLERGINEIEHALGRIEKRLTGLSTSSRPGRKARGKKAGRKARGSKVCTVRDCQKPSRSRGLCGAHYMAALRHGEFRGIGPKGKGKSRTQTKLRGKKVGRKARGEKVCSVRDCQKPSRSRGLCGAHYMAALRRGDFK